MKKTEWANELHDRKYNCCQATACVYAEELGADRAEVFRIAEGFGLGAGCMEGICGALSGALMLAGLKNSDGNLEAPGSKPETYKLSEEIVRLFRDRVGALVCREIKGVDTGVVLCTCPDCIRTAVEIGQEVLGLPME